MKQSKAYKATMYNQFTTLETAMIRRAEQKLFLWSDFMDMTDVLCGDWSARPRAYSSEVMIHSPVGVVECGGGSADAKKNVGNWAYCKQSQDSFVGIDLQVDSHASRF